MGIQNNETVYNPININKRSINTTYITEDERTKTKIASKQLSEYENRIRTKINATSTTSIDDINQNTFSKNIKIHHRIKRNVLNGTTTTIENGKSNTYKNIPQIEIKKNSNQQHDLNDRKISVLLHNVTLLNEDEYRLDELISKK